MLKKITTLPSQHYQSLSEKTQGELTRLFQAPYREVFQLQYLYASPLCRSHPAFLEVIGLLESFNAQTKDIQDKKIEDCSNPLRIVCMRFIYRQMLSVAVMGEKEVKQNDYASRLKNWYFQLNERHCFQGVNFKRRKEQDRLQEIVRSSFTSNVFDEIDDYIRKRINYQPQPKKKTVEDGLPLIDIHLYKREQALLRQHRQKANESRYFKALRSNKSQLRENTFTNIRNRHFKNQPFSELRNSFNVSTSTHSSMSDLKSWGLTGCDWRKPAQMQSTMSRLKRCELLSIDGINLMRCKD